MLKRFKSKLRYPLIAGGLVALGVGVLAIPDSTVEKRDPARSYPRESISAGTERSADGSKQSVPTVTHAEVPAVGASGMRAYLDEDGNPAPPPPGYRFPANPNSSKRSKIGYQLKSLPGGGVRAVPNRPLISYSAPRLTADGKVEIICSKTRPPEVSKETIRGFSVETNEGEAEDSPSAMRSAESEVRGE